MKLVQKSVDAQPSKRLYQSIIADYSSELAICELIDNAIDLWIKGGKKKKLVVDVEIDVNQQRISVKDNAGGITESDIKMIIAPGYSSNSASDETIGVFGVGSKRAVVALAQEIKFRTRHENEKTLLLEYNDEWLADESTWDINYFEDTNEIESNNTIIELTKLRAAIDEQFIIDLKNHLGSTYSKFLSNANLILSINKEKIEPLNFDLSWSYPPNYHPHQYDFKIDVNTTSEVSVEILGGLVSKDQVGVGEYGVYFYCNDRLVLKADKSYEMGFASGIAGIPHPSLNSMRIFVYLKGNPELMPWNSSKSGINYKNKIFLEIRDKIITLVTYFAKLSRSFMRNSENFHKYTNGKIVTHKIDISTPIKLYPLPTPIKKPNYENYVKEKNAKTSTSKPWTIGLYEAIILADNLIHTNFESKNRFAIIVLDSTLEIALKEYLVHVVSKKLPIGHSKLVGILQNRTQVEAEVKNYLKKKVSASDWALVDHYYKMRCNLIHQVSTADVKNTDIEKHRDVVEKILGVLFKLEF